MRASSSGSSRKRAAIQRISARTTDHLGRWPIQCDVAGPTFCTSTEAAGARPALHVSHHSLDNYAGDPLSRSRFRLSMTHAACLKRLLLAVALLTTAGCDLLDDNLGVTCTD